MKTFCVGITAVNKAQLIDEELRRQNMTNLSVWAELFVVFSILSDFGIFFLQIIAKLFAVHINKMKFLALIFLSAIFTKEIQATLEFQLANLSHAGFSGKLDIKIGKSCFPDQNGCTFRKRINTEETGSEIF